MIEVPFFSFDLSLGIKVSGLAFALLRSKMMRDGRSSPFCFNLSVRSFSAFTNSTYTFILRAVSWILARKNKSSTKAKILEAMSSAAVPGTGSGSAGL
jgi:hypothetical protein